MNWVSTKIRLPPEGSYLCIVDMWKSSWGATSSYTGPAQFITEFYFNPERGWASALVQESFEVKYWMEKPQMPEEKNTCGD
jgi:hypothetical protein